MGGESLRIKLSTVSNHSLGSHVKERDLSYTGSRKASMVVVTLSGYNFQSIKVKPLA